MRIELQYESCSRGAIQVTSRLTGCIFALGIGLAAGRASAFNSEEHKVLVDLAVSQIVLPPGIQLPYPTRFDSSTVATLRASYTAAKQLAVGYASNNATWHSNCQPGAGDPTPYPAAYSDRRLHVQDNAYWDEGHESFNQIEGNLNMWIPPTGLVRERALWVTAKVDATSKVFSFGDLVSLYGDYRKTTYCPGGTCYLSDANVANIGFTRGNDCYGVWPFQTCGYEPEAVSSDVYLRRIAAGLWPPYGCLGNAISNTAGATEYGDAGWWGDEMMRIALINDWHFSRAAVAWYTGLHRLALIYVNAARTNPAQWNTALHYEANALHALTDLFCFGHIVTNRDETAYGIIKQEGLLANPAYEWLQNVIGMGGGQRNAAGRVALATLPQTVADAPAVRNDVLWISYAPIANWASWGIQEHTYHSDYNAAGATVRNLRGDRFDIHGDGAVRGYSDADREVIVGAVRTSLQRLFEAHALLQAGASVNALAAPGTEYFDALKWIPVFVESEPGNRFRNRWTRYAGAIATTTGSSIVPADWTACQMTYVNGGTSLPPPDGTQCPAFPLVTSVRVENLALAAGEDRVSLSWNLVPQAVHEIAGIDVQRAPEFGGPYVNRNRARLLPDPSMSYDDLEVESGATYWYRLELADADGSRSIAGPVQAVIASPGSMRTALAAPFVGASGDVEVRFSLGSGTPAAQLRIYDVAGRLVRTMTRGVLGPGHFVRTWNRCDESGAPVARGVYVVRLQAGGTGASRKIVLVQNSRF